MTRGRGAFRQPTLQVWAAASSPLSALLSDEGHHVWPAASGLGAAAPDGDLVRPTGPGEQGLSLSPLAGCALLGALSPTGCAFGQKIADKAPRTVSCTRNGYLLGAVPGQSAVREANEAGRGYRR